MSDLGKILIFFGLTLVVAGGFLVVFGRMGGFGLGRLPGDILIRRDNTVFTFPLASCLLVSVLVSLVLYFIRR